MKEKIIRTINGRKYVYRLAHKKVKGSKFLTHYYKYDGPVKAVYAEGLDTLSATEVSALDAGFRKGLSIETLLQNIMRGHRGKIRPAASTLYQWFSRRGVKRDKKYKGKNKKQG